MPSLRRKFNEDQVFYGISAKQNTPKRQPASTPGHKNATSPAKPAVATVPTKPSPAKPVPILATTNATAISSASCPCNTTRNSDGNLVCPCVKIVRDPTKIPVNATTETVVRKVSLNTTEEESDTNSTNLSEFGEERKYTGNFPWWLLPLIFLGLILLVLLLFCVMNRKKTSNVSSGNMKKSAPESAENKEAAIEKEISDQLKARVENNIQNA